MHKLTTFIQIFSFDKHQQSFGNACANELKHDFLIGISTILSVNLLC